MVRSIDDEKSFTVNATIWKGQKSSYVKAQEINPFRPCEPREIKKDSLCHHVADATDIKGNQAIKRVYGGEGKSPTLTTMGGGHREPKVLVPPKEVQDCIEQGMKNVAFTETRTEQAKQLTFFEKLKIGASTVLPFLKTGEEVAKAISSENEKTLELTDKIQDTRNKILDLDINIAKVNKEETDEEEKQLNLLDKQLQKEI